VCGVQAIVGTLHHCTVFHEDNREALVSSATSYSSKLLKKVDQCRAVCSCSHLGWQALPCAVEAPGKDKEEKDDKKEKEKEVKSEVELPEALDSAKEKPMAAAAETAVVVKKKLPPMGGGLAPVRDAPKVCAAQR
jgi:Vacuolar protein sorting-associated protein 35